MRLLPEQRQSMVGAVRRGFKKTLVAEVFDVSRKTVTTWSKRAKHRGRESFRDKKHNQIPGRFDKNNHPGWTYTIDLNDWEPDTELFIAAHAVVGKSINCERVYETAWGDGDGFDGKNWATYFTYTVQAVQ